MTGKIYHPEDKHPEPYQQDLNPEANVGQNYGHVGPHPEKNNPRTAYDVKEVHARLRGYSDDDLKRIPILPEGTRLEPGATYIDLAEPQPKEFNGRANMAAEPGHAIVPKTDVPYPLWNRLIGVTDPERLDQKSE